MFSKGSARILLLKSQGFICVWALLCCIGFKIARAHSELSSFSKLIKCDIQLKKYNHVKYFIWWFKALALLLSRLFRSTDPERRPDCRSVLRSSWGERLSLVLTHTELHARLLTLLNCCSHLVVLPLGEMCWPKAHASPIQRNSPLHRYLSEFVYSNWWARVPTCWKILGFVMLFSSHGKFHTCHGK